MDVDFSSQDYFRNPAAAIAITTRAIFFVTLRQRTVRRSQPLAGKVT
jgi:hypothetical protein